jgi:release factor glutamine methyltransferase
MLSQDARWLLVEKYQGQESAEYRADLERLAAGEPLAYVIGSVPFLECQIWLDSRPLIPRPETEFWVDLVIKEIQKLSLFSEQSLKILDLCAGSGCVGVAIAKAVPTSQIDFIELDSSHLPTIQKNCQANGVSEDRVRVLSGDLFKTSGGEIISQYDFILSNPPYISEKLNRAEESVLKHEPHLALFSGIDGLDLIREIIIESPKYLRPKGQLWLEHEPEQAAEVVTLGEENGFRVTNYEDQYQRQRFSRLVLQ